MGVDFFPCDYCSDSICDCGSWERCNENCGRRWCDMKCARADGYKSEGEDEDEDGDFSPSCKYCRDEDATDTSLLYFLLKWYGTTLDKAKKLYVEHGGVVPRGKNAKKTKSGKRKAVHPVSGEEAGECELQVASDAGRVPENEGQAVEGATEAQTPGVA